MAGFYGTLKKHIDQKLREELDSLRPQEAAVLAFLRERVARELASAKDSRLKKGAFRRQWPGGPSSAFKPRCV
jgi:hypothetical protein